MTAHDREFDDVLQAASPGGHEKAVRLQMLLDQVGSGACS